MGAINSLEDLSGLPHRFQSAAVYDRNGDVLEFFVADEEYYADRVDEYLTVYRSMQDRERTVGIALKSIRSVLLAFLDDLAVRVDGQAMRDTIRLKSLIVAALGRKREPRNAEAYFSLIFNEQYDIEVPAHELLDAA